MTGHLPNTTGVDLAEEEIDQDGHCPQEGVVFPIAHGIELLGSDRRARALRRRPRPLSRTVSHGSDECGEEETGLRRRAAWAATEGEAFPSRVLWLLEPGDAEREFIPVSRAKELGSRLQCLAVRRCSCGVYDTSNRCVGVSLRRGCVWYRGPGCGKAGTASSSR